MTDMLTTRKQLKAMMDMPGNWIDRVSQHRSLDKRILDLDSFVNENVRTPKTTRITREKWRKARRPAIPRRVNHFVDFCLLPMCQRSVEHDRTTSSRRSVVKPSSDDILAISLQMSDDLGVVVKTAVIITVNVFRRTVTHLEQNHDRVHPPERLQSVLSTERRVYGEIDLFTSGNTKPLRFKWSEFRQAILLWWIEASDRLDVEGR